MLAGDELETVVVGDTLRDARITAASQTYEVATYQDKSRCIDQVLAYVEQAGVRRKYRQLIGQCLDEMLMNAIYDAPATRPDLVGQIARVQLACDADRVAISVRDSYGTLERQTLLRYLHKCLHSRQQIDDKVGGAGLGLYMIVSSATTVVFEVTRGVSTEVTCTFDLKTPRVLLQQLSFVERP